MFWHNKEEEQIYVSYDKNTLEAKTVTGYKIIDGEDIIGCMTPILGENEEGFFVEVFETDSSAPQDNFVDIERKALIKKPSFKLELSDPSIEPGEIYELKITFIDNAGNEITPKEPFDIKIKDTLDFISISDKVLTYSEPVSIRLKAYAPGQSRVRVKDCEYKYVPAYQYINIKAPSF